MTDTTPTITVEDAERVLRADYWADIRRMAEDAEDGVKNGTITDEDSYRTYLEQTVDGCSRVIYTGQALDSLRWCENQDAYTEQTGEPPLTDGKDLNWSALAYFAILEDVQSMAKSFEDLQPEEDDEAES